MITLAAAHIETKSNSRFFLSILFTLFVLLAADMQYFNLI